jgi:hypothetical protein
MSRAAMIRLAGPALMVAALPGCARWQGADARVEPPPAVSAQASPELPDAPPPGAGAIPPDEAAREPGLDSVPAPRFVRGTALLDAPVEDQEGRCVGRLLDVLVEPGSGRVVAVLLELEPTPLSGRSASEGAWLCLLDPDRLLCTLEDGALRLALFGPVAAPPVVAGGGQEEARAVGQVTEIVLGSSGELIVKLRDESNLVHRLLVEPACLVRGELDRIAAAGPVEARGVLTRDSSGKLLVASTVGNPGAEPLALRGPGGGLLWRGLARGLRSGRSVLQSGVIASDGVRFDVGDWLLDSGSLAASHVLLRAGAAERVLPWAALSWEPDGRVRIAGATDWVEALPASFRGVAAERPELD